MLGYGLIAILMAIFVPTFQAQKATAVSTNTTANIKQLVNAIESCAASRIDGSYTGGTDPGDDCLDAATLKTYESSLSTLQLGAAVPASGGYQVAPVGSDGMGYLIQAATTGTPTAYFAEIHRSDGTLLKLCGTKPFTATDTTGDGAPGCEGGTW